MLHRQKVLKQKVLKQKVLKQKVLKQKVLKQKVLIRSDGPSIYWPRIITADELCATLMKDVFFSPEFPNAQVIWSGLLAACHEEATSSENAEQHDPKPKDGERADTSAPLDPKARSEDTSARKRRRGPLPEERIKAEKRMRKDIEQGVRSADELRDMKEEALRHVRGLKPVTIEGDRFQRRQASMAYLL